MVRNLIRWLVLTISVWAAEAIVPGIDYDRPSRLIIAALILGILNTLVKPALRLLAIPFIVLTFGLFLLAINAALLGDTAWFVPGFRVAGFWSAVGGSLVISAVSMALGYSGARRRVVMGRTDTLFTSPRPPPGKGRIIDV